MKTLKKLLIQLVAVAMVVLCISAIPALTDYSFGSFYTDYISTTSSQKLGPHQYEKRDIGCSNIRATAPNRTRSRLSFKIIYKELGILRAFWRNFPGRHKSFRWILLVG